MCENCEKLKEELRKTRVDLLAEREMVDDAERGFMKIKDIAEGFGVCKIQNKEYKCPECGSMSYGQENNLDFYCSRCGAQMQRSKLRSKR